MLWREIVYKHLLCVEENKENTEQVVAQEGETVTKETVDIYEAQGYVAEEFIEEREYNEEERGYFDSGYMTLPDEDPDEDKTKFLYPENYKEIADMQLRILEEQYKAVINGTTLPTDTPLGLCCFFD